MNKILLSIVAILGLGAGAYYLLPQDQINQYAKYLPEPVSSLLVKEVVDTSVDVVSEESPDAVSEEPSVASNRLENATNSQQDGFVDQTPMGQSSSVAGDNTENQQQNENPQAEEQMAQAAAPEPKQEVINQPVEAQATAKQVKANSPSTVAKTQKMTPEMEKLQKEIDKVQKSISKLDGENSALETRFQKILKKNRDLAIELKKIDQQLEATN